MKAPKPTLFIIPGLGDRVKWYAKLVPLWDKLGFDTHIHSFDWEESRKDFKKSLDELLGKIDAQNAPVYVIGASAGGTAAVNALLSRPDIVKRVVTAATPFQYPPHLKNLKLQDSIRCLSGRNSASHILSVNGLYDQKVPAAYAKYNTAQSRRIPVLGHGAIIVCALTIYATHIGRFLRS